MNDASRMTERALVPGFANPVHDAQSVFRAALRALAAPGTVIDCPVVVRAPQPLHSTTAALALTLADFEVSIWLDEPLASRPEIGRYLEFHTGARIITDCQHANIALITNVETMPPLLAFAQGSLDYPDRSTTLIIQVAGFGTTTQFEGPGIRDRIAFNPIPAPSDFGAQFVENRSRFPCGVDLLFASPTAFAALPRSSRWIGG